MARRARQRPQQPQPQPQPRRRRWPLGLALAALAAAGLALALSVTAGHGVAGEDGPTCGAGGDDGAAACPSEPQEEQDERTNGGVPVRQWSTAARERALRERTPVVFENAPSDAWLAHRVLTNPRALEEVVGPDTPVQVYRGESNRVLYHKPEMPLAKAMEWHQPYEKINVPARHLVESLVNGKAPDGSYYYHSQPPIKEFQPLIGDIEPFSVRHENNDEFTANVQTHVWAGCANMSARVHYDTYFNFYVQVLGRKRFVLLPPEEWQRMRLFPAMHPSGRQSQFDIFDRPPGGPEPFDVVLEPGQVLFLPPYWFHQVEAVDVSLSINVWTDSFDQHLEHYCSYRCIPGMQDEGLAPLVKVAGVFKLLGLLMRELPTLLEGVRGVLDTQYAVMGAGKDPEQQCAMLQTTVPSALDAEVRETATMIASRFREMHSEAVRQIAFSNLVQTAAYWAVGFELVQFLTCVEQLGDGRLDRPVLD